MNLYAGQVLRYSTLCGREDEETAGHVGSSTGSQNRTKFYCVHFGSFSTYAALRDAFRDEQWVITIPQQGVTVG